MTSYKKIDREDILALDDILGHSGRLLHGEDIDESYSHDELVGSGSYPEVVAKPLSPAEVSGIMRLAWERNIPVTPRGAGTGLVGGAIPVHGGILLDMSLMNRIIELDEDNMTITVEPGVLLSELNALVEARGLFYPPDPGEKNATLGGNISTNAGGMRAVKYGATREYARGLEVVLPNGEIIEVGGKIVKNSSGYDLKDLIAGSEGTLGVITKAILKLLPLPATTVSLLVPFPSLSQAISVVPEIIRSRVIPTAIEFMERDILLYTEKYLDKKFPDNASPAYLLLRFDGQTIKDIERDCESVARICRERSAHDVFVFDTKELEAPVWDIRGSFLDAIKKATPAIEEVDAVVPRSEVSALVDYLRVVQEETGVPIQCYGHAGDGNVHVYLLKKSLDERDVNPNIKLAMDKIYDYAKELGGQVSGEHGIGHEKREYLSASLSAPVLELMRGIKKTFDPKNILNPSKIL